MEYVILVLILIFMVSSIYSFSNQAIMSRLLRNKGEKTIPMFFLPSDLRKFKQIIIDEENPDKQKKLISLFNHFRISISISITSFILLALLALFRPF